jgi:phosphoribosylamine---glycine ligase
MNHHAEKNGNGHDAGISKKKFLFVSYIGLAVDLAWQVKKEGHDVKFFLHYSDEGIGSGFFPIVKNWKSEVAWADVIVFDDVEGMGKYAKRLRSQGKLVFGGTPYTDRLEDDRSFGQDEMKLRDIPILSYQIFNDFDEGIKYVRENPGAYVIKPSGPAPDYKGLLFVGQDEDGSDVVRMLETYKRVWASKMKQFQLQKKVSGVEVGVTAFFNGKRFITPININFEHKRLYPGEVGPQTGEMGTSMFWSSPNRLFNSTLKKFEEKLAEEKYVGPIDLNCIVNNNGIYPLEFTARIGYPTIHIMLEGINMPAGELLYALASGVDFELKTKKGFQVGVLIATPPFPYEDKKLFEMMTKDTAVVFAKRANGEGVHLGDLKLVNGEWIIAGYMGIAAIVVGTGQTMRQAQAQAYNRVQNLLIPNMFYRTDIGDRWVEDSDKLHNWGYLRET